MSDMCGNSVLLKIGYWFYVNTRFGRWYFNRSLERIETSFPLGHSAPLMMDFDDFHVHIVAYSKDNYGFIIWRNDSQKCVIVDPGYFPPFALVLSAKNLILDSVLITHKHYDHCGSVNGIKALFPHVKIIAHKNDRISACSYNFTDPIVYIDVCEESTNPIQITAYHTPGHTVGHAIYTINTLEKNPESSLLVFTGDAIFLGSIGAMFEGTIKVTVSSLQFFLRELLKLNIPANKIHLFPGHEYSAESLQFVVYNCSPYSTLAKKKLSWCEEQRNWLLPTIPVTLFDELSYSPYLRVAISTFPGEERLTRSSVLFAFTLFLYDGIIMAHEGIIGVFSALGVNLFFMKLSQNALRAKFRTYQSENIHKVFFLPHIQELIHEFLLSETFIKSSLVKKQTEFKLIKEKLFLDLFSGKKKMLLRCESCSPEPFTLKSTESTLPSKCVMDS